MKTILAFGDSLTWGSCPRTDNRHPLANRWPHAMAEWLEGVHIISEGLRGRTTAFSRPTASVEMSGAAVLPMLLHTHGPIDLVMIMLGTNDIYEAIALHQIQGGLYRLIEIVRNHPWRIPQCITPKIMLISPPTYTAVENTDATPERVAQSQQLSKIIEALAIQHECAFFDAATIVRGSVVDGIHLDADDSRALGLALRPIVRDLLGHF